MTEHVIKIEESVAKTHPGGFTVLPKHRAVCSCNWKMHEWVKSRDAAVAIGHLHRLAHG